MPKSLSAGLVSACAVLLSLTPVSAVRAHAETVDVDFRDFIVNGVETQSRPTTGALLEGGGSGFQQTCSGTLIGCQSFLTAAHCVCPGNGFCTPNPSAFSVYLQHAGVLSVSAVDVHPDYFFGSQSDIAVLTLTSPLEGIRPTPINTVGDPPHGTAGVIAGFGIVDAFTGASGLLREGQVTTALCSSAPEPEHVCWDFTNPIGPPGTESNTCSGDSGGPLFANIGGEKVIGVTSGGDSFSCLAPDNSFDANVFRNAAFIQSVAGADLLNLTCGAIPQVGAGASVIATSKSGLDKSVLKCRREVRKQYAKYTAAVLKAEADCLGAVGTGAITGPCPDLRAQQKIGKAVSKVDPAKIAKKCPDAIVSDVGLAGDCAGAGDGADLASCILLAGDTAVAAMLTVSYADDAPVAMIPASACQAAIGKTMVKYQKSSLKAFNKCEDGLDKGKVFGCPDTRTAESVAKAHTKVEQGIARACTNAEIVSLDSGGAFGGSCSGSVDTTDLAACQVAEYDVASSALVALIDSAEGVGTVSFVVPGGADRFRATVNAVVGGGNDVDLYVRHGSPPTKSVFDAQSAVGGVFEGVEIANPTAGEWFVLVDEASGNNIPTQVTITIFP